MKNLLDQVVITPQVARNWTKVSLGVIQKLPKPLNPQDFGDEDAEQLPNGNLRIFATYKGNRIAEMEVPADQWSWRFHTN